ncbi:ornithine cyclodeaminase family protein [Halopenitus sp. H-Gu1]|uniref:ornithine cyclodeaminase family protein n=1 Tax=Halopenitus sp. H-Gu1 TaxID=3242697 RepID=UPI00359D185D
MTDVRFLTSEDVTGLATPAEYVDAVRDAYRQRGEGAPARPRTKLTSDEPAGMMTGYLAILPDSGVMGGYMYSAGFGATDAWFVTPLFDSESGAPKALLDGASMNPFKTGATGAVGVDALAREDASEIGIIGAGSQARGQLRAIATIGDFETVRVHSRTAESREAFAEELAEFVEPEIVPVETSSEAVAPADVVVTATTASEPVVDDEDITPGTHITAMGRYDPNARELEAETIARATYVPDLHDRAFQDAGSFLQALEEGLIDEDHVHAELGEIVAGAAPGRQSDEEITIFDSGGTGIETVAAAKLLYDRAVEADLGTFIELSPASEALTGR